MIVFIIVLSFVLESMFSTIIPINTNFLNPVFVLMSLILIVPYFNKFDKKYLITCSIVGLFYDIAFTNTIVFYAVIYLLMGLVIRFISSRLSHSILSVNLLAIIIIIFYRTVVYFILVAINYFKFDISHLLHGIYSSILLNLIYISLLYLLLEFICKKLHIKKI